MTGSDWRDGHARLAERIAALPALAARAAREGDGACEVDEGGGLVATGIGSSEAHARLLAHLVAERTRRPARFVPASTLLAPSVTPSADTLVVFSQGLSPNAQLVLPQAGRWPRVVVATSVTDPARLAPLRARGVTVIFFAGENEFGTLVRVTGPLAGSLCAIRLARAFGASIDVPERIERALESAFAAGARIAPLALRAPLAFIASGPYGELVTNLRLKVLEGMLRPLPPAWDLLHLAHGPFQQAITGPVVFLALTRADAPGEEPLLVRFEAMLEPDRHTLLRLHASLPSPFALLEHEMHLNALLLHELEARGIDQARWPGRGLDAPLYGLSSPPLDRRLAACTWRDVEALLAQGCRTAILPLGSTEQHGGHLALDTDTVIGDALAARLGAAVGDAIVCPTLPVGCASEHLGFPGTLHVDPATLTAVVRDLIRALGRHGIARVFLFSAHGGNVGALRAMLPSLERDCAPVVVSAFADLDVLTSALHAESAEAGIPLGEAGHHAGEIETSIMLALDPARVRTAMAPGIAAGSDAQPLFYPDLRINAPDGVVGDPRRADAARGLRYLRAWTKLLVDAYVA